MDLGIVPHVDRERVAQLVAASGLDVAVADVTCAVVSKVFVTSIVAVPDTTLQFVETSG